MIAVPRLADYLGILSLAPKYTGSRPSLQLLGDTVPTVDTFITCCGEDVSIVKDTLEAACALDYPRDKHKIYILDDKSCKHTQALVHDTQQRFNNVHYASRGVNVSTHSKAGNLNFGLSETHQNGKAEFLAVLDVDMLPDPQWLRSLLPHLLQDPQVGVVTPPQNFYNMPSRDPLGTNLDLHHLYSVSIALQDSRNSAWCTGTGFVARRSAIDDIGGFPSDSLTEDVLAFLQVVSRGWKALFVPEAVQWGISPLAFDSIVRQRQRWARGLMDILKILDSISPEIRGDLVLISLVFATASVATTVGICVLPLTLFSSEMLVPVSRGLVYLAFADFAIQVLYGMIKVGMTQRLTCVLHHLSILWIAPYQCLNTLETYLCPNDKPFLPTGVTGLRNRNSMIQRLRKVCLHLVITVLLVTLCLHWSTNLPTWWRGGVITDPLTHAGWPPIFMLWTAILSNAFAPVLYTVFPPKPFERGSLLERGTGVVPSAEAKKRGQQRVVEWHLFMMVCYWVIVLVSIRPFIM